MTTYESPKIVELGSVADVTRASGDQKAWDSNLGMLGFLGGLGNGGTPSAPSGSNA